MGNKIYFIIAKNFVSLFHTRRGDGNQKNKAEPRNPILQFFPINFDG